tara:strand:+ start:8147 stop:8434 length:288 start_codon:yes stop_codon:yes gene_type:complete
MPNMNRAKTAACTIPELKAELERHMNFHRPIYQGDVIALAKEIRDSIVDIYVGPGPHTVLEWKHRNRLAAKEDARALANAIAAHHRKVKPHLYNK